MNRPQKNKAKNPTLPEDEIVDERNLIDVEDSADISIEDRIHMYWMENKGFVSTCVTVLALAIIAVNGLRMYASHTESQLQSAYAEAVAAESLEDFATEHSDTPLGGMAALDVADTAYNAEEFAKAAQFYAIAAEALSDDILAARAKLGLAFASYYDGDSESSLHSSAPSRPTPLSHRPSVRRQLTTSQ